MVLILQVAAGVFLGQVALTAFWFYVGRYYAKRRVADAIKLLQKAASEKKERKPDGGQYL